MCSELPEDEVPDADAAAELPARNGEGAEEACELELAGINYCGGTADTGRGVDMTRPIEVDPAIRAVVVGLDRQINCA